MCAAATAILATYWIPTRLGRAWPFAPELSTHAEKALIRLGVRSNIQNTPVLRGPNTDPVSGAFGTITAQEPPRSFQFSLNLQF